MPWRPKPGRPLSIRSRQNPHERDTSWDEAGVRNLARKDLWGVCHSGCCTAGTDTRCLPPPWDKRHAAQYWICSGLSDVLRVSKQKASTMVSVHVHVPVPVPVPLQYEACSGTRTPTKPQQQVLLAWPTDDGTSHGLRPLHLPLTHLQGALCDERECSSDRLLLDRLISLP